MQSGGDDKTDDLQSIYNEGNRASSMGDCQRSDRTIPNPQRVWIRAYGASPPARVGKPRVNHRSGAHSMIPLFGGHLVATSPRIGARCELVRVGGRFPFTTCPCPANERARRSSVYSLPTMMGAFPYRDSHLLRTMSLFPCRRGSVVHIKQTNGASVAGDAS